MLEFKNVLTKDELEFLIIKSFKDIHLDGGVGLFEAQAIDDWLSDEEIIQIRNEDEKNEWQKIPVDVLENCSSSLGFVDSKGMRFLLPAFLLAEVREECDKWVLPYLTVEVDESYIEKFSLLNEAQKRTVTEFLKWTLNHDSYSSSHNEVLDILTMPNSFWFESMESDSFDSHL